MGRDGEASAEPGWGRVRRCDPDGPTLIAARSSLPMKGREKYEREKNAFVLRTFLNVRIKGVDTWTVRDERTIGTIAAAGFRRARRGPVSRC
ncbi:MAG: hypothetical protein B7Y85_13845, partial [Brevundimonas sp. 32-68-21]